MSISRLDLNSAEDRFLYVNGQGHMLGLPTKPGTSSAATTGVPTNSIQGFAPGAIFCNFKGAAGTAFYINVGTFASSQWVPSDLGGNGLATLTAATSLTALLNGGRNNLLSLAAGFTATLPAATGTGMFYAFTVLTLSTTGAYIVNTAPTTDIFCGSLLVGIDASNTSSPTLFKTASNSNTVTIGTTTPTTGGAAIGDTFIVQDIAAGKWLISGTLVGAGTLATPFSHV